MTPVEFVFHNIKLIHENNVTTASVLVRDGYIKRFGKEPVIDGIPEKFHRFRIDTNDAIILPGLKDQLSFIDHIRTDKDLERMIQEMTSGGIIGSAVSWSKLPTRVSWLEMSRRIKKTDFNMLLYGTEDYITRWSKLELPKYRVLTYYPQISEFTQLYGKYLPNEMDNLQFLSPTEERRIIENHKNTKFIGTTTLSSSNAIPFLHSLIYDAKNTISTNIPKRHPKIRYNLIENFHEIMAIGHGKFEEYKPAINIAKHAIPLIFDFKNNQIQNFTPVTPEDTSFVLIEKNTEDKPKDLPVHISNPSYRVINTYSNGKMLYSEQDLQL